MTYRPYPDPARARRQIDRHHPAPAPTTPHLRLAEDARRALEAAEVQLRPFGDAMREWATAAAANLQREAPITKRVASMLKEHAAAS